MLSSRPSATPVQRRRQARPRSLTLGSSLDNAACILQVAGWLETNRGLRLKAPEARVLSCAGTVDGLGYRITRSTRTPRIRTLRRLQGRVAAEYRGGGEVDLDRSLAATAGIWSF